MNTRRDFIKVTSVDGGEIIIPVDTIRSILQIKGGSDIICDMYEYDVKESVTTIYEMLANTGRTEK